MSAGHINFSLIRNEQGRPVAVVTAQYAVDPLSLLRAMKKFYPELFNQVALELILPESAAGMNGNGDAPYGPVKPTNRIITDG